MCYRRRIGPLLVMGGLWSLIVTPGAYAFCGWDPFTLDPIELSIGEQVVRNVTCQDDFTGAPLFFDPQISTGPVDPQVAAISPAQAALSPTPVAFTITGIAAGNAVLHFQYLDPETSESVGFFNTPVIVSSGPAVAVTQPPPGVINADVGGTETQVVTVSNVGDADLVLHEVAGTDALLPPFRIIADLCSNKTLQPPNSVTLEPGETCTVEVGFSPTVPSTYGDSFNIPSNDPNRPDVTVELVGTATQPVIAVFSEVLVFQNIDVHSTAIATVTVSSAGDGDLSIHKVAGTDGLAPPFSITMDLCSNATRPPGDSCDIEVEFKPTEAGTFSESFNIPSNDPERPDVEVILTGTAVAPPPETTANANGNAASAADPVSTATGELYFSTLDLDLGGPLSLAFGRYYASALDAASDVPSSLGNNWMHTFDLSLKVSDGVATVIYHGGKTIEFEGTETGWTLQNPEPIIYRLVEAGGEYRLMDPSNSLVFTFGGTGALTRIEDRNGNALSLTYADELLDQVSDGLGRTLAFTHNAGKLTRLQSPNGRSITFSYSGDNLAGHTDAEGHTTAYSYTEAGDLVGLMTAQTRPQGNIPFTQTYDSQGRVNSQSDASGNTLSLAFDTPSHGVTQVSDALSNAVKHTHESRQNFTRQQDADGEVFSTTYDANNRRTSLTDRLGATSSFTYHEASGLLESYTDALGNTTTHTYTARTQGDFTFYDLTGVDYPDGTATGMGYDAAGNLLTLTGRAGEVWTYTYNERGQVLTATNPDGGVSASTYHADGTRATVRDHHGNTTEYGYDDNKRLSDLAHPDGATTSLTYDDLDQLLTLIDEKGNTTTFTYDDNGNLETVSDALGRTQRLTYNDNDRPVSVTDPLGATTTFSYDELQRLQAVRNPLGQTATYGHDGHGRLTSVTDPTGMTTTTSFDRQGVISSIADPLNNTYDYITDDLGRVTQVTSPLGNSRSQTYDSMGRITETIDPLSRTTSYTYDSREDLTSITMPDGSAAVYTRNDLGLITRVTDPNGGSWDRTYDAMGRLVSVVDPLSHATSLSYNNRSVVSSVALPEGTLNVTYETSGNIAEKSYSDGTRLTFAYDDAGRFLTTSGLDLVYDERGAIVACNGLTVTRDELGRIASITLAPGKSITYAYNSRGLVSEVMDWVGDTTSLTYDGAGRMIGLARPNGVATQYTYDEDGRLMSTRAAYSGGMSSIALVRDGRGHITSATRSVPLSPELGSETSAFGYNSAHQVAAYSYDGMGRLTADDARTYTWDLASRLTSYTEDGKTVRFTYDGLGMRLSRTGDGATREHIWNYALGLPSVSVIRDDLSDVRYYVHLPNGVLLHSIEATDNSRSFFHFDEVGTTLFLTDDSGAITDRYASTPFGRPAGQTGTTENPFVFLGAYGVMREGESGLHFARARYYDAAAARFVTPDAVKSIDPQLINPYQYARANPLLYADLTGMDAKVIQDGIHTSIKVDVWRDGQLIGTFHLSFYPECWLVRDWDVGDLVSATQALTWGQKGVFHGGFQRTKAGVGRAGENQIRIEGSREADERLGRAMLQAIGVDPGTRATGEVLEELYPKGVRWKGCRAIPAAGYGRYRVLTQVCNDFTDDMLDIYFGYDWSGLSGKMLGFWRGSSLMYELRRHLRWIAEGSPDCETSAIRARATEAAGSGLYDGLMNEGIAPTHPGVFPMYDR